MEEDSTQIKEVKQGSIDTLSKEEIISKYKNLVVILKKAKAAKDEALIENDKLKSENAKVIRTLEVQRNKAEEEADALQEMVANLTENKMTLVTKNESLQRQLNLQLTEVNSMKSTQKELAAERGNLIKETIQLKKIIEAQQDKFKDMQLQIESKMAASDGLWISEKEKLVDKIEVLEAQVTQMKLLKNECMKKEEEKLEALAKFTDLGQKQRVLMEDKKAMAIIHNELKSQNVILDSKLKAHIREIDELRQNIAQPKIIKEKNSSVEEDELLHYKHELEKSNSIHNELKIKYEVSLINIKEVENELNVMKQKHCDLLPLYKKAEKDIGELSDIQKMLECKLKQKEQICIELKENIEQLEAQSGNKTHSNTDELKFKDKNEELQSQNQLYLNSVEELNIEIERLKRFQGRIWAFFNTGANKIVEDEDIILTIEGMRNKIDQSAVDYANLKENMLKLINLTVYLHPLKDNEPENFKTDDISTKFSLLILHLESLVENYVTCDLKNLCNACSSTLNEFCLDVEKIETLFSDFISSEFSLPSIDSISCDEIISKPLCDILNNFIKILSHISYLFGFVLNPEMISSINVSCSKIETLKCVIFELFQTSLANRTETKKLTNLIATHKAVQEEQVSKIEEQNSVIHSLELDLKALKQRYNESEQAKHVQEKAYSDLTDEKDELQKCSNERSIENEKKISDLEHQLQRCSQDLKDKIVLDEKLTSLQNELRCSGESNELLKSNTVDLENQVEVLTKEKESLEEKLICSRNELGHTITSLDTKIKEAEEVRLHLNSIEEEKKLLQGELASIKVDMVQSIEYGESLVNSIENVKAQLEAALNDKSVLAQELLILKNKLLDNDNLHKSQLSTVNKLETDLQSLAHANKLLSEELISVKDELNKYIELDKCSQSEMAKTKIDFEQLNEENNLLKKEVSLAQAELKEAVKCQNIHSLETIKVKGELEELVKTNISFTENFSSLKERMEKSERSYASKCTEIKTLKDNLESITEANKLISEEFLSVKEESNHKEESLSKELKKFEEHLGSVMEENILLKGEKSFFEHELAKFYDLTTSQDKQKAELDLALEAKESLMLELKSLKEQLKESINSRKSFCEDNQSLKTEIESLTNANEFLDKELISVKEDLNSSKESHLNVLKQNKAELDLALEAKELSILELKSLKEQLKELIESRESYCEDKQSLKTKIESLTNANDFLNKELISVKENLNSSKECYLNELKQNKAELDLALEAKESLKVELKSLLEELKMRESYSQEIETLQSKIESSSKTNEALSKELVSVQEELGKSIQINELHCTEIDNLTKQLENITQEKDMLEKNISILRNELDDSMKCQKHFRELLQESKLELQEVKSESKVLKVTSISAELSTQSDPTDSSTHLTPLLKNNEEEESKDVSPSADWAVEEAVGNESLRYKEIIMELNEMNQIIRKRGEKISILEDKIQKQTCENEILVGQLSELQTKLSSGEQLLASKQEELDRIQASTPSAEPSTTSFEHQIQILEEENSQLKKMLKSEASQKEGSIPCMGDTQSETMSTSTISKFEDSQRMKEMEDTFEERYMKLKSLAIQLKRKLAEQTSKVKVLEENKVKLAAENDELLKKGSGVSSKNIQVLQKEIDRLQDSLDANTKEMRAREKQLVASAKECADFKSKCVVIEEENLSLTRKIENLQETLENREKLVGSHMERVSLLEIKLHSEEAKVNELQGEQKLFGEKSEMVKKDKDNLLKKLEEVKQESKKHSLIDLEMKDYERSIEELRIQVEEKSVVVSDLTSQFENEKKKTEALKEEISLLREQVEHETNRAEELKKTVNNYKKQLSELRQNQAKEMQEREKEKITNEKLIQELEDQKLAVAEISAHSSQMEAKYRKDIELYEEKVDLLEEKLGKNDQTQQVLQSELKSLQKEYDAYKIRAQSVLRQQSRVPQENYEQVKAEREQLSANLESTQILTHQLQSEFAAAKENILTLSNEKQSLSLQLRSLTSDFAKKESEFQDKIAALEKKLESKILEYQRVISAMSTQNEAVIKSYKMQLETQKDNNLKQIKEFETKLEEKEEEIWQIKNHTRVAATSGKVVSKQEMGDAISPLASLHLKKVNQGSNVTEDIRIDVTNMIREEGEGSEWVEPHPHRSSLQHLYHPPPFDQLINGPISPQQAPVDEIMSVASVATEYSNREMARLEAKLSGYEVRIQQLTTLLSEAESENAKLIQLSDTLKDDIRRTARNEEREKHLENNEYIKNIILKFLHLKIGDERYRLVPVLKTLLQLSKDETDKLTVLAKGEDPQNMPQGWGDYLHLWSGR